MLPCSILIRHTINDFKWLHLISGGCVLKKNLGELEMLRKLSAMAMAMVVANGVGSLEANADGLNGGYAGVQAGPWLGASEVSYSDGTNTATAKGVSTDGFAGGLFAGYGKSFDNTYIGGEFEFSVSNADTTATVNGSTASVDVKYYYAAHARLGYLLSEKAMVYAKAGISRLHWDASSNNGYSDSDAQTGGSFGAGLEHLIGDAWGVRAEFLYTVYGDYSETQGAEILEVDPKSLSAMLGISYRF